MELPEVFKKHPWAIASVILVGGIILYLYWRGGSSATVDGTYTAGVDPQIAALNAQLQAASLNYNAHQAELEAAKEIKMAEVDAINKQTAAALQLGEDQNTTAAYLAKYQTDAAVAMQMSANGAAVSIAGIQGSSAYQIAQISASRDVSIASINAQTQQEQIEAVLAGLQDTNRTNLTAHLSDNVTAVDLATIGANRDITINNTNNETTRFGMEVQHDLGLAQFNTQFLINRDNNNAAITINQQNVDGAVTINGQNVDGAVTINQQNTDAAVTINAQNNTTLQRYIDVSGEVANHQLDITGNIVNGVNAGIYNKGGEGGANQVSVVAALVHEPSIAASAQAGQVGAGQQIPNTIGAVGSVIGAILGGN